MKVVSFYERSIAKVFCGCVGELLRGLAGKHRKKVTGQSPAIRNHALRAGGLFHRRIPHNRVVPAPDQTKRLIYAHNRRLVWLARDL